MEARRTVAVGLDGCSWNVLGPLLDTGRLPNLAALRDSGASAILESTIPFFTGPAWASIATGCTPAAHGIYDFMMLRPNFELSVAHQSDLHRPTYYHQLGRDAPSVLVNMPLDQDGCPGTVIVNSWLTDDDERRILPVGRRDRYARLLASYRTFPDDPSDVDELCALEEARFDLARELFLRETWSHFFVLFSSTDWFGHSATGHFLEGDEGARAAFLRLYEQIDTYIGWMAERAPDAVMFVLSDHGQCEEKAVVRVNAVLNELGLVELMSPHEPEESPFFVDRQLRPRRTIGIPIALSRHRNHPLVRPLALTVKRALRRGLSIELTRARRLVNAARSTAFSPTDASFAVYVRDDAADVIESIRTALLDVRLEDGTAAIDDVWTPEELYGYRPEGSAPTLLFSPAVGVRPSAAIKDSIVSPPRGVGRGCHQRDGMLMVAGSDVASGEIGRASIYDIAPTLLWTMGRGVPRGTDGRVLIELFDATFALTRPVLEIDPVPMDSGAPPISGGNDEVERRLRALGYA